VLQNIKKPSQSVVNSSKGGGNTYQSTTKSASQKASLNEYRAFLRNKNKQAADANP
jgi:hypothetical protein